METLRLKALSLLTLHGNRKGNFRETSSFLDSQQTFSEVKETYKAPPATLAGIPKSRPAEIIPMNAAIKFELPDGQNFWGCTSPEAIAAVPKGEVYFLPEEVDRLLKMGKASREAVLRIKNVFRRSYIQSVTNNKM